MVIDSVTAGIGYYRCQDFEEASTGVIKEDIVTEEETTDGSVITMLGVVGQSESNTGIIKEDIVTEDETTDGSITSDLASHHGPVHLENEVSNTAVSFLS